MEYAKVMTDESGQAVWLPEDCRFDEDEVLVNRIGSVVILSPKGAPWQSMLEGLDMFTEDFLADGVDDPPPQERPAL